ncbi:MULTISPECIES: transglutaminase-like domain-containing protein [unclassified Delftia]|uniref:transglutaminase-like domain-containing protein n=1 Tax=unclassified Delftia TaxID=2613839 RepID=UPI0019002494|nr:MULTISPECIES: transglutaminase-like domain-containing protein [unclassified Delftia]MBK0111365.1 transglutaminase domain-containing protein [Delftia sp. S65]MBK0116816.1 transglutaminase domain-containing protein [Delftia sp. S67]MBK0128083.1 transglutaminase domain-containing protein [Delftia sp. S66]
MKDAFYLAANLVQAKRRKFLLSLGWSTAGFLVGCGGGGNSQDEPPGSSGNLPELVPSPEGDAIFLTGDDPSNPLHIFLTPITRRIQVLAEDLGKGAVSVFEKIDRFISYIDGFDVGNASSPDPDATVLERIGACGTYTGVLLALTRCIGIPGRYVNFYNWPVNNGHTVAELFINGRWMLFDPTYHLYYSEAGRAGDYPLSYEEILHRYRTNLPVVRVGQNTRDGLNEFSGVNLYTNASPQGVIGPDHPLAFPLRLHAQDKPIIGSSDFPLFNQGAEYLGAAGVNIEQSWDLSGLEIGREYKFCIIADWLGGYINADDYLFDFSYELKSAIDLNSPKSYFDFKNDDVSPFELKFMAQQENVVLNIKHPYRGPQFRYLIVSEYKLLAGDS